MALLYVHTSVVTTITPQAFLFNDLIIRAKVVKPNEKYLYEESAG
jgi:hypothetical protein